MSYSFNVRAANKAEAKQKVREQFGVVLAQQPVHAAEQAQALAAADAFIDVLPDDETQDLSVSVSGYLSWSGDAAEPLLTAASVSVNAGLVVRDAVEA